jgi:hypothetical protein
MKLPYQDAAGWLMIAPVTVDAHTAGRRSVGRSPVRLESRTLDWRHSQSPPFGPHARARREVPARPQ